MKKLAAVITSAAILLAVPPPPLSAQQLGIYLAAHGYRVSSWYDFNHTGYVPAYALFDAAHTDVSTPAGFNLRYGGVSSTFSLVCGPDYKQGADDVTTFRATYAACLTLCPCHDGTCAAVCSPDRLPPYRAKGYGAGELVSPDEITTFFRVVGIPGPATPLDLLDAKLVLGAYAGLIQAANGGGITAPPAANPGTVPPVPTPITPPSATPVPPTTAADCGTWRGQLVTIMTGRPSGCGTTLPPGAIMYGTGTDSTGRIQVVVVP